MHSLHQLLLASASYLSLFSCHRSNLTMMMLFSSCLSSFLIFLFLFVRLFLVFLLRFLLLVFLFLLLTVGIRTIRRRARHGFFSNYTCCKCACRFALLILLYEDIKVDKTWWYRPAKVNNRGSAACDVLMSHCCAMFWLCLAKQLSVSPLYSGYVWLVGSRTSASNNQLRIQLRWLRRYHFWRESWKWTHTKIYKNHKAEVTNLNCSHQNRQALSAE